MVSPARDGTFDAIEAELDASRTSFEADAITVARRYAPPAN
jgi:hypothetical protein